MTSLELGPLLRHVGTTTATIWVETSARCTVEVLGSSASTFEVCGQHYALVTVEGLEPGTCRAYEVRLDGEVVWPIEGASTPPSYLRTRREAGDEERLRVVFGSCRYPPTDDPELEASLGIDALDAFATRLMDDVADAADPAAVLPDAVCLLGDQVYADELTPRTERWIRSRRDPDSPDGPGLEIADYGEYAHLYSESWSDRELRWLLSTVPTAMIFDDHDVRDDWNTSQAWRDEMADQPWWPQRIRAGLASYWVYQHLGNLDPDTRDADPLYRKVVEADGDVYELLADFAGRADAEVGEPTGVRWSYRWDLGRTRLLMIDSRCARVLNAQDRLMINDHSFAWIAENAHAEGDVDHLLLGSSIPWLMPPAVSHVQSLDELAAAKGSRLAESVRQAVDLEHWPAFRASFDRLAELVRDIASGSSAPATVCVLSGDVHHSYAAEARYPTPTRSRVYQLTCSPVRNGVPWFMEYVFALGWWRRLAGVLGRVAKVAGLDDPPLTWSTVGGPWFGNAVSTLEVSGLDARLRVERSGARGGLEAIAELPLT